MDRKLVRFCLGAGVLLSCSLGAWAGQEISVGRVDLQLPGEGWQAFTLDDKGVVLSGSGYTYQQTVGFKLIVRPGPNGVLDAVMLVRANASGKGKFSGIVFPNARCDVAASVFAEGDQGGPAARSFKCLQVVGQQALAMPPALPAGSKDLLVENGWRLPPVMFAVSSVQYAHTGAFAEVTVFLRPLAAATVAVDKPRAVPDTLPAGVTPASVQWGRQLQEAVSDSVYSIRGKLPVPELTFAD